MGFSAELAHEAVSRSPPDSLEQAVEYCFNHPNAAATTSTASAAAPPPPPSTTTTTTTSAQIEDILSNLLPPSTSSSGEAAATPVIEVSASLPSIRQSLATIQHTLDLIDVVKGRDEKPTIHEEDADQVVHQLDKVILDKFANNMLPGLTKILDNVPDTVYRVCDLIVVVVKKYGDQWRDNALLYILNETCDLIKQVCDIYSSISSSKAGKCKKTKQFFLTCSS